MTTGVAAFTDAAWSALHRFWKKIFPGGIESQEIRAGEEHGGHASTDGCDNARRVTGFIACGCPQHLPGLRVERDDAGIRAADVGDEPSLIEHRRSPGAKESLCYLEARVCVLAPVPLARSEIERVQLPLSAEGIHDAVRDDGCRPRAFVKAKIVAIGCGIVVFPLGLPEAASMDSTIS